MDFTIMVVILLFFFILLPACGFYWGPPGILGVALLAGFLYLIYRAGGTKY